MLLQWLTFVRPFFIILLIWTSAFGLIHTTSELMMGLGWAQGSQMDQFKWHSLPGPGTQTYKKVMVNQNRCPQGLHIHSVSLCTQHPYSLPHCFFVCFPTLSLCCSLTNSYTISQVESLGEAQDLHFYFPISPLDSGSWAYHRRDEKEGRQDRSKLACVKDIHLTSSCSLYNFRPPLSAGW